MCFILYQEGEINSYESFMALLKSFIKTIVDQAIPEKEYTLFRQQSLRNFEAFYIADFPNEFHESLKTAFQEILSE